MIEVEQHAEEGSATPGNSCNWVATCTIAGQVYTARSRRGAPHELARLLIGVGIPDQPMRVYSAGIAGYATYPSIHKAAGFTIKESASTAVRLGRWEPAPAEWPGKRSGEAENRGVSLAGED